MMWFPLARLVDIIFFSIIAVLLLRGQLSMKREHLVLLVAVLVGLSMAIVKEIFFVDFSNFLSILQFYTVFLVLLFVPLRDPVKSLTSLFYFSSFMFFVLIIMRIFAMEEISGSLIGNLINYRNQVPGLNNTAASILGILAINTYIFSMFVRRGIALPYGGLIIFILFVLASIYPSRQLLVSLPFLVIGLYWAAPHLRRNIIFLILIGIAIFVASGVGDFVFNRISQHFSLGGSYSRIEQFKLAIDLLSANPFFGTPNGLTEELANSRFKVLESSYSDVLVKYGVVGAFILVTPILLSLTKFSGWQLFLVCAFGVIFIFNEVLFEEIFGFFIALIIKTHASVKRDASLTLDSVAENRHFVNSMQNSADS
jgi:hypothetical protein